MDLIITLVLVFAVQALLYLMLKRRIRDEMNTDSLLKEVRDEVDSLVRELNASAERNIGLLEARIEELEGLLARADQKIVVLARELDRRERHAEVYSNLKRPAVAEPPVVEAPPPPPREVVTPPARETPAVRPRPLRERVLELREHGASAAAIASATGATLAEVELILTLADNR